MHRIIGNKETFIGFNMTRRLRVTTVGVSNSMVQLPTAYIYCFQMNALYFSIKFSFTMSLQTAQQNTAVLLLNLSIDYPKNLASGTEISLTQHVEANVRKMIFICCSYDIYPSVDGMYGIKDNKTNKWNGMMGMLERKV